MFNQMEYIAINAALQNGKVIHEGGNSRVYEWEEQNRHIIIKKYSNENKNWLERFEREETALQLLEHNRILNVPRLLYSDSLNGILATDKLPGKRPQKLTLKIFKEHYKMMNSLGFRKLEIPDKLTIMNASDSLLDPNRFITKIEEELINLENLICKARDELEGFLSEAHELVQKKKEQYKDSTNQSIEKNKIKVFSFSDLGPRNTLIDKDDIYFVDFEHSGWDDPIKGIIDLLICPSNHTTKEDAEAIIRYMFEQGDGSRAERLLEWIEILNIKWVILYVKYGIKVDKNKKVSSREIENIFSNGKRLQRCIENVIDLSRKKS
tara:strand:- start:5335 stop:6303 length:969 start_codon:yes stop_codon:yes gene_type:complete